MSNGSRAAFTWVVLTAIAAAATGCGDDRAPAGDGGADPRFVGRLATAEDFARQAGEQWAVKYLLPVDGRSAPAPLDRACAFQDTATYPLHLGFLRTFPEFTTLDFDTYLALVMNRATRLWWAGELRLFAGAHHPVSGRPGVMGFFVYADADEPLSPQAVAEVHRRLVACVPYARDLLVLVGADTAQAAAFRAQAGALADLGVYVADHADLVPRVPAEGYSSGLAFGYLRIVPRGAPPPADVGPRDLLVVEGASEDIGLVAGLVTALPQNVHSHLNLRLREKAIPNARIADVLDDQALAQLDGRLARLDVTEATAALAPALLEDAEAFWARRMPAVVLPPADLDETRLLPFEVIAAGDADAYGSKAANLGELHAVLPEGNRVAGFGIPFSLYRDWMAETGMSARVEALLDDPRTAADAGFRRAALAALRDSVEDAPVASALIARLAAAAEAAYGAGYATRPIRLRSSSNVEDGTALSGAGLHDSSRGCFADDQDGDDAGPSRCLSEAERAEMAAELARRQAELAMFPDRSWLHALVNDLSSDLTKERSVARALRKVYAGLWNDRAYEERAYFRIDHRTALMGVAVNPSFVLERADAVAVTNLGGGETGGEPYYRVVSQVNGQPVVRPPDPTQVAETVTFQRGPGDAVTGVRVLASSSLSPGPIWSAARLDELGRLLFLVHDHFAAAVYPARDPLRLDLEIKLTEDDRIVIKQARPYVSPAL
jgi:pyruvate, water dikinase